MDPYLFCAIPDPDLSNIGVVARLRILYACKRNKVKYYDFALFTHFKLSKKLLFLLNMRNNQSKYFFLHTIA
jgi:hypothetical protein